MGWVLGYVSYGTPGSGIIVRYGSGKDLCSTRPLRKFYTEGESC